MKEENRKKNTIPTTAQIKFAFAQLALLGCVPPPKAQTSNMISPTIGMQEIKMVKTHSPVFTGSRSSEKFFSMICFLRLIIKLTTELALFLKIKDELGNQFNLLLFVKILYYES